MVGEISWINCWGNCGPIKPQEQSQKLYTVTNCLSLLISGGIERVARRGFEINEFLMILEFFQGICSLNLILGFYMLAPKIDKASSYFFFLSSLLVQMDRITSKWLSSYLFHTVDGNTWHFKIYWWWQPNKALKFLIRGCDLFTLDLLIRVSIQISLIH